MCDRSEASLKNLLTAACLSFTLLTAEESISPLKLNGVIEAPENNMEIRSPVQGVVTRVYIKEGDHVSRGQSLFQLDDSALKAQLKVQAAQVEIAEANLERLKNRVSSLKSVKDFRIVSKKELQARQDAVTIAEAQLKSLEAQVRETELHIKSMGVRSSIDGIVLVNNLKPGFFLVAGGDPPVLILRDPKKFLVRIEVVNGLNVSSSTEAVVSSKNGEAPIFLHFQQKEASSEDLPLSYVLYSLDLPKGVSPYKIGEKVEVTLQLPLQKSSNGP